jgi:Uma2 family endonuclease
VALPVTRKRTFTPEEYLELERKAEFRSEYVAGKIFALAGASEKHNTIVTNLVIALGTQLKGKPCKVYSNDLRVRTEQTYTYPDVLVLCGEASFADDRRDTLVNPTLILEVLSPSTEGYDRGGKFESYRALGSLAAYVLVSQETPHLEVFERQEGSRWLLTEYRGLEAVVPLPAIGCQLLLGEVYDKVALN